MEGADAGKLIATFKAEIAKLKPKLPKTYQGLEDQAQVLEGIKECREKKVIKEKMLKEQVQKAQDTKQQIDLQLLIDLKEIDDFAKAQKKMYEEAAKKRQELQEATIVEM